MTAHSDSLQIQRHALPPTPRTLGIRINEEHGHFEINAKSYPAACSGRDSALYWLVVVYLFLGL